ncbi:MAG: BlaR1 family beta-lactam sensor/signal transducer, partial [Ruminococcus sp.]|nr:BlaR1 family beta-lactam sensor/signal transducer [Ruminococcus sp.]
MANFMIRFLVSNIFISGIIGILLLFKRIFKNSLSSRMQYNLWFLLLGLLAVPFIPFRFIGLTQTFFWLGSLGGSAFSGTGTNIAGTAEAVTTGNTNWMNDFTLSVNSETHSIAGYILLGIWIVGILAMIILIIKALLRLHILEKSALPLQNQEVRRLYHRCLEEMGIHRDIPIYSTVFLKSPIIVGLLKPRIYLPIHLISDYSPSRSANSEGGCITGCPNGCDETDMRYMLLHELQHYKHHDAIANYLMNLTGVVYWFNPLVWYALKEMRNDREVACDTSVLEMLEEDAYEDYGNTLINFVEKVSLTPFPFAAGLGGNMKQMKRRIINIASYEKPTFIKRLKGMTAFMLTAVLLLGLAPILSTYTAEVSHYQWKTSSENISYVDFSSYFGEYEGSFVLYDLENDSWSIHDMDHATSRVAPDSTYKIYDALFGLEEGVITPEDSFIAWNGESYPFEAWNADQTLQSAMASSVNWYFQSVDEQLGTASVYDYIKEIGYGNENMSGDFSTYWMESSLEISPIEQVELLIKLQNNSFDFAPENINAVKDAICLSSSDAGTFYGKTGT